MKTILVTNENVKAIASNDADKSVFEKYDYDIQIKNDGTLDELQQVQQILYKTYGKRK